MPCGEVGRAARLAWLSLSWARGRRWYNRYAREPLDPGRPRCRFRVRRGKMKISLKVQGKEEFDLEMHPEMGILDLKALIEDMTEMEMAEQRIMHKGRALHDDDTLQSAGAHTGGGSKTLRGDGKMLTRACVCLLSQASMRAPSYLWRRILARRLRKASTHRRSCRSRDSRRRRMSTTRWRRC